MTYSIVALDDATGARGVAVASKALCVGAHVPWGAAGVGALATQAWHDLRYGFEGLALLEAGHSAASVVQSLTHDDSEAPHRQLGVVDRDGRVASYTGSRCLSWAGGMCGSRYAVQGNLLAGARVLESMADAYEHGAALPFAHRLVSSLLAGDEAGGDRRGRQSAALKVWRAESLGGSRDLGVIADLRVDDAPRPVHCLLDLLPRLWLERGSPIMADAIRLTEPVRTRIAEALHASPAAAEQALARWASEHNLEHRLLDGFVDPIVLEVLESDEALVLETAAAAPPAQGWPG